MAARIADGRRLSCGSLFVSMDYTTLESQLTERIEMAEAEIKKLEDEVSGVVEKVMPMFGQLQEIISDVNGDELSRFIHVVSAMSADDKMRIVQTIDEAGKQEKKQALKVVE